MPSVVVGNRGNYNGPFTIPSRPIPSGIENTVTVVFARDNGLDVGDVPIDPWTDVGPDTLWFKAELSMDNGQTWGTLFEVTANGGAFFTVDGSLSRETTVTAFLPPSQGPLRRVRGEGNFGTSCSTEITLITEERTWSFTV